MQWKHWHIDMNNWCNQYVAGYVFTVRNSSQVDVRSDKVQAALQQELENQQVFIRHEALVMKKENQQRFQTVCISAQ